MFSQHGIKNTQQRSYVYEVLRSASQAMTAEEIYLTLTSRDTVIHLSTIYRILEMFVEKELALKTNLSNSKKTVFEINRMEHKHYLICTGCHKNVEIHQCPLEALENSLEKETNYKIVGHKLDVYGYCPDCQEKLQQED